MPATSTRLLDPSELIALGYCGQDRDEAPSVDSFFGRPRHGRTSRRAATTPGMARLKELIYPHVHGIKTPVGVRPSVEKAVLMSKWNGGRIHSIPKLPNYKLADHAKGDRTLYYWSRPDGRETLFMIDIDIMKSQKKGTAEGGRAFADYLDRHVLPGCHWETSTHGVGVQGFGIMDHGPSPASAVEIKQALDKMQDDFVAVAKAVDADIELVEVKGHPPVVVHGGRNEARNSDIISSMTYGQFAKVPRDLEAVARLQPVDLGRLHAAAEEARARAKPEDKPKAGKKAKSKQKAFGSCTGRVVTEEMLSIMPQLEKIGEGILAGRQPLDGRKATAYDVACVLLLAWTFNHGPNANADGAMPTRRFEAMWDALYAAGDFHRGWSPNKFKAVRDLLSERGLIDWIDETYCHEQGGGRACRWRLTAELTALIDGLAASGTGEGEGEAPSVNSSLTELVQAMPRTGQNLRPVRVWAVRRAPRLTKTYLHEYSLAA